LGIQTLEKINKIIPDDFLDIARQHLIYCTFGEIIWQLMVINDVDKLLNTHNYKIINFKREEIELFNSYGINLKTKTESHHMTLDVRG